MNLGRQMLVATLVLSTFFAPSISADPYISDSGHPPAGQPAIQQIERPFSSTAVRGMREFARAEGSPYIEALLDTDWVPEGHLAAPNVDAQRQRLAAIQNRVLAKLRIVAPDLQSIQYQYIPVIAVPYSEMALDALVLMEEVSGLSLNVFHTVATPDTVVQTEAVYVQARGGAGAGQVVAIIDTGITAAPGGPLAGKIVGEACSSTYDSSNGISGLCFGGTQPTVTWSTASGSAVACTPAGTTCKHGTNMAGVVSAMAPSATILSIQAASKRGSTIGFYDANTAEALAYVYSLRNSMNFASVNMSFGDTLAYPGNCSPSFSVAYSASLLQSVGILMVAAAGNQGHTNGISHPACLAAVLGVGGVLKNSNPSTADTAWSNSNRYSNMAFWAPGDHGTIVTVGVDGMTDYTGGTSAASAHVAGAIAALRSAWPGATTVGIVQSLASSGRPSVNGKPSIRMDLALPPTTASITTYQCYGWTDVAWSSVPWGSGPSSPYYDVQLQQVGWSGWTSWTWVSSASTTAFLDVPYDSYVAVRLCDNGRCGAGRVAPGKARYYSYCL